jgi:hypothetical protein
MQNVTNGTRFNKRNEAERHVGCTNNLKRAENYAKPLPIHELDAFIDDISQLALSRTVKTTRKKGRKLFR